VYTLKSRVGGVEVEAICNQPEVRGDLCFKEDHFAIGLLALRYSEHPGL